MHHDIIVRKGHLFCFPRSCHFDFVLKNCNLIDGLTNYRPTLKFLMLFYYALWGNSQKYYGSFTLGYLKNGVHKTKLKEY